MKNSIWIAILTILPLSVLWGQELQRDSLTVVARSGLNIRELPSVSARKLVTVPFGGQVEALEEWNYDGFEYADSVFVDGIKGKWIQVNYNGEKGYAFDGYLIHYQRPTKLNNNDYLMIYDGGYCGNALIDLRTENNVYGLYDLGNGRMEFAPVKLNYRSEISAFGYRWLRAYTPRVDTAVWLLATQKPMKTGIIKGQRMIQNSPRNEGSLTGQINYPPMNLSLDFNWVNLEDPKLSQVVLRIGTKQQTLFAIKQEPDDKWDNAWFDWVGDLDMDGKPDLMFSRGRYYFAKVELWLSSLAKPGELVGKAFSQGEMGCC